MDYRQEGEADDGGSDEEGGGSWMVRMARNLGELEREGEKEIGKRGTERGAEGNRTGCAEWSLRRESSKAVDKDNVTEFGGSARSDGI